MKQKSLTLIRLGSGAGYSGDRIEPALALDKHGKSLSSALLDMEL